VTCTGPDGSSARNLRGILSESVPTAGAVGLFGLAFNQSVLILSNFTQNLNTAF
jgi:hypothetical protein